MTGAPTLGRVLATWHFEPGVTGSLLAAGAVYALAARRTRWRPQRTAFFLLGLAATAFALESGLDAFAGSRLSVHMVQHLVLTLVAAPLLVAGAPVTLALRTLPTGPRRRLGALVTGRLGAVVRPSVGVAAFAVVTLATHLTGFYELALRHEAVHAVEHGLYLAAALLFWAPVIATEPLRHSAGWLGRLVCILLAMVPMTLVGVVLGMSGAVRYAAYEQPARAMGFSALADQHQAGALMWVGGSVIAALLALLVTWSGLAAEERREVAREAHSRRRAAAGPVGR